MTGSHHTRTGTSPQLAVPKTLKQHAKLWWARLVGLSGGRVTAAWEIPGIPGRVHHADTMFDPNDANGVAYYLRAGASAVEVLDQTMRSATVSRLSIGRVLDYGCGYGRVLRHLRTFLPEAQLVACDLDPQAVHFCSKEFGARGIVAPKQPSRLKLPPCDLVWGGSVWTHLPEAEGRQLFSALANALKPNGILVFSFHGAFAYENLDTLFGGSYAEDSSGVQAEIEETGISYRSYPERYLTLGEGSYGTAWHHPDFYRSLARARNDLDEVWHAPRGWDRFHDVIAFQRRSSHATDRD
jgi:SAM-dependent methyltransferase